MRPRVPPARPLDSGPAKASMPGLWQDGTRGAVMRRTVEISLDRQVC
jgi:hypothetical protein